MIDTLRAWHDTFNVWHRGIRVNINLVDQCSCRCPACWVGNSGRTLDGYRMSFDHYKRIIDKLADETHVRTFIPSMFSEPLIHPDFPTFIRYASRHEFPYMVLPTTLSRLNCNLKDVAQCGLHEIVISWEGWSKHKKYRGGMPVEPVLKNMEKLAAISPRSVVTVRYHKYRDNADEVEKARAYVEALGFKWNIVRAYFFNLEKQVLGEYTDQDRAFIKDNLINDVDAVARKYAGETHCLMQRRHISIDAHGRALLCSCISSRPEFILGDFLKMSLKEIIKAQVAHPFCAKCSASGYRYMYRDETDYGEDA